MASDRSVLRPEEHDTRQTLLMHCRSVPWHSTSSVSCTSGPISLAIVWQEAKSFLSYHGYLVVQPIANAIPSFATVCRHTTRRSAPGIVGQRADILSVAPALRDSPPAGSDGMPAGNDGVDSWRPREGMLFRQVRLHSVAPRGVMTWLAAIDAQPPLPHVFTHHDDFGLSARNWYSSPLLSQGMVNESTTHLADIQFSATKWVLAAVQDLPQHETSQPD